MGVSSDIIQASGNILEFTISETYSMGWADRSSTQEQFLENKMRRSSSAYLQSH